MKTLVLSMISIAATVAAMTACTSESDPVDEVVNPKDAKVEIKATAGIGSINVETKAAINPKEELSGVQFVRIDGETPSWTAATVTCTGTIAATTGTIVFSNPQYYPQTGNANFISYYPAGTLETGIVSYTGLDGTTDIMCTNVVTANRTQIAGTPTVDFALNHLLTQLNIQVKAKDDEAIANWGKITKIELLGQLPEAKLTLNPKALAFEGTATSFVVSSTETTLTTDATPIGTIMAQAEQSEYKIKVTTQNAESTITFNSDKIAGTASTAYTITLNFNGKNIESQGTIGEWNDGGNTSGDLE